MSSLWQLGVPLYEKDMENIKEEKREEILHQKRLILPRFKELYNMRNPPPHPYKVKMQIREELEIAATQKQRFQETAKALDLLKEEFEEDWHNRETQKIKEELNGGTN